MTWLVTGVGAVASVGGNADETFASLVAGRTGHGELRAFDRASYGAEYAYEMHDRPIQGKDLPRRASRWVCEAVAQAATDAGIGTDLADVPILVGTGLRELRSLELWHRDGVQFGPDELHFGTALKDRFGAATTYTFSNACSASLYALALASDMLSAQTADTVIVAGVDMITESMFGLVERIHPVPPDRVAPFDRNRKGAVMGEGAAAIVLRRDTLAERPAAAGVLRSVGINCDAFHVTAPSPAGIATAIRDAHTRAGVKPEDVDLVMLHGTGTLLNDEAEAVAIGDVFGAHTGRPLMTAIKSMTGHTSGASGLLALIVALRALGTGRVPPTIGLADPVDEAKDFRFVLPGSAPAQPMSLAQVNAFGFGGINAVAMVEAVR